jgi:hypothetical protein
MTKMVTVSTSVITVRMIPSDPSKSCHIFSVLVKEPADGAHLPHLIWDLRLQADTGWSR